MQRAARQIFDGSAVQITGGKVHGGEFAGIAQQYVDQTDLFEELRPVHIRQQPHAGDDVTHRNIGGALPLMLVAHQLVTIGIAQCQPGIQPQ